MIEEVITTILEAEKKSDDIIKNAKIDAKVIDQEGNEKARMIKNDSLAKIKEERRNKLANAEKEATENYNKKVEEARKGAEELKKNAQKNIDKAVDYIVGGIV